MALDFLGDDELVAYFKDLDDLWHQRNSGHSVSMAGWLTSTYGMSALVARQIVEAYEKKEADMEDEVSS